VGEIEKMPEYQLADMYSMPDEGKLLLDIEIINHLTK
jgi:hypothetical protein